MTLEMKGIYKSFGANDVLRDVSFTLNGGEICALLGDCLLYTSDAADE